VVSRGSGKIGFGLGNLESPTLYAIIVEPISMFPNKPFDKGTKLQISERIRNHPKALDPAMKSGNYLNSLLAYLSAAEAGYDDALMVDQQGFMTEGTTFNLFYVNRGIVATAPLDVGILDGVTRRAILNLCIEQGLPCREVRFPKEYLYEADEVFVSSSLKEVLPVLDLDGKKIGNGKAGPVTRKLRDAFDDLVRRELSLA
jgi:branched-chain amino acid aminotransferase